jgi:UDP-glucose:(heptosyl)LPS alpha-1,3-glucosyltransferase
MTERLRIVMVALDFHRQGGSEGRTGHLVDSLVEAGHEVHLVGARILGRWDPRISCHVIPLPRRPKWLETLAFLSGAARFVTKGQWNVVHNQIRPYIPGVVTAGGGCHRFYLERVLPEEQGPLRAWAKRVSPLHRILLGLERRRYCAKGGTWVIANSRLNRDGILAFYPLPEARIRVVYNGVDSARFTPENVGRFRTGVRQDLNLTAEDVVLLFVGSNFRRKGLALVLEGLAATWAGRRMRLVVVGGRESPRWRRRVTDLGLAARVRFVGQVADPERYYAAADAFVLPTHFDPFANATLEAMAAGLPVVTTRSNGVAEVLTPGMDGFVLEDSRDAGGLEKALAELMDPDRRRAMGAAARATASRFPWAATTAGTLEVYRAMRENP